MEITMRGMKSYPIGRRSAAAIGLFLPVCVSLCGFFLTLPLQAAVWKNTVSNGDWNNNGNWDVALTTTTTCIFNTSSPAGIVTLSTNSTVARIRQDALYPRTIQISAGALVDRTLTLSGSAAELIDMSATASGRDLVLSGAANPNGARLRLQLDATKPIGVASTLSSVTVSCEITGGGGFIKTNAGTLILSGTNTYVGPTTVNGGTLLVNGSIAAGSVVSVGSGATLGGTGTIAGPVTVAAGGSIGAGASVGILTLTNGLNLSAGGTNVWELSANSTNSPGTNFDQIVLTGGALTLNGASRLKIKFIGTATAPDSSNAFWQSPRSWKIISVNGGANAGNSNFSFIENGSYAAGSFSTSVDASGGIVLNFKPPGPFDFATASSRPFPSGVRGQNPSRTADAANFQSMFNMSSPSLMRGIAGGLDADSYDWRVINSGCLWAQPGSATLVTSLDFLRKCRDTGSSPLFTANMFGGGTNNSYATYICVFDIHKNVFNPSGYGTNAVTGTAAQLAADWVRYCNILAQTYRQGQESLIGNDPNFNAANNAENLRVYNSVKFGGNWAGRDVLLTNGEPAVPKVSWWEIGNEPEVDFWPESGIMYQHGIADKILYRDRYRVIANAMKAVDASIQTGPCVIDGNEWLGRVAEDPTAPLDFVGIHPYYSDVKTSWPNTTNITAALLRIGQFIAGQSYSAGSTLGNYGGATRSGTKPAGWQWSTPLVASEYNPVNWDAPPQIMNSTASRLALLEHCFRFTHPSRTTNAFASYLSANYWESSLGNVILTNEFAALRDFAGDLILENPLPGPQPVPDFGPLAGPLRVYVTWQTNGANKIHIWGINFSESTNSTASLGFTNLPFTVRGVILRSFGKPGADNSLTNATGLGWTTQDVTGSVNPANLSFTVGKASFAILTFQEAPAQAGVPFFSPPVRSGTNLLLRGANGVTGASYYLLTSTNVSPPISNWTRVLTNTYGVGGSFSDNVPLNPADHARLFRLQSAN
jgi:autotransporter-associated beta strand protein